MHVAEFRRMNANITVEGRSANKSKVNYKVLKLKQRIYVRAALILAGVAEGTTQVTELKHLTVVTLISMRN